MPVFKNDVDGSTYNYIADLDEMMIGVGSGVLMGPTTTNNQAYQSNASHVMSENCFSTYNTPKFK